VQSKHGIHAFAEQSLGLSAKALGCICLNPPLGQCGASTQVTIHATHGETVQVFASSGYRVLLSRVIPSVLVYPYRHGPGLYHLDLATYNPESLEWTTGTLQLPSQLNLCEILRPIPGLRRVDLVSTFLFDDRLGIVILQLHFILFLALRVQD
jgi:hypothetical protein